MARVTEAGVVRMGNPGNIPVYGDYVDLDE
jgi:hypothetical protein